MFWCMATRIPPRLPGDIGERSALDWLLNRPHAGVFVPLGHSPDADVIADLDGALIRIQVKTSTVLETNNRYRVTLATRGCNRSWNGLVKRFSSHRCDYLFVLVADGRRWFIPATAVEGGAAIVVGGPKYAAFEVERGRPIAEMYGA
jgi:hypothetical protein